MSYPRVTGEAETLALVAAGRSIARYGDGEFRLCADWPAKAQRPDPALRARLRAILVDSGDCLVGIPNLHSATPKSDFWRAYLDASCLLTDRPYVSSFITRPDSAPWIDTPAQWAQLRSLWLAEAVTLVRGSASSFTAAQLVAAGAGEVTEVVAPREHAWDAYDELLEHVGTPRRALLCLGPTATVMAVDLCAKGVHAIDVGHAGLFFRKHLTGEPMVRTEADKVAWKVS